MRAQHVDAMSCAVESMLKAQPGKDSDAAADEEEQVDDGHSSGETCASDEVEVEREKEDSGSDMSDHLLSTIHQPDYIHAPVMALTEDDVAVHSNDYCCRHWHLGAFKTAMQHTRDGLDAPQALRAALGRQAALAEGSVAMMGRITGERSNILGKIIDGLKELIVGMTADATRRFFADHLPKSSPRKQNPQPDRPSLEAIPTRSIASVSGRTRDTYMCDEAVYGKRSMSMSRKTEHCEFAQGHNLRLIPHSVAGFHEGLCLSLATFCYFTPHYSSFILSTD
ncbi:uncharacterized protein MYCGRDRAFT_97664 [Zymoseptoria tritici IPO323]|uniref:Uncharacterized protein n=1 Tax=Zymoseptoria tritici (strain CBS 115943 / IPO323) TaxID=336722 RepID=F9XQX6_ZYMTI|nr:uncharacterized protein MYCGRDRAFT_97664 [Zymoseptoria tritici IPO323]EGP82308.1 hypothetical protein MYCGRDRAFT_97664 [Zymoseptoria tritici IPO323]